MDKTIIAKRLKRSREKKKFTQIDVYSKTGINNKTLSGYENNVSSPDLETLKILADLYEVTADYLLGGNEEYKKEAAEMLPLVMEELESLALKESPEFYEYIKTIPKEKLEKELAEILPIAGKIKGLSAKNKEAILTIIESLSSR